jgi:CopG family nickel-responsive transcriptional regulator
MQRLTITIDDDLMAEVDAFISASSASNRSEAIRDLVRRGLTSRPGLMTETQCFGVVSCAVDQSVRNLGSRVPQGRLERHDQTVAAMSVPLDHSTSIEVAVMRGQATEVQAYADALFIERGVLHGTLALIPVAAETTFHAHGAGRAHSHVHLKVQESF